MPRTAVLFDFGGVLTTSVIAAFREFGARIGSDPELPFRLLSQDTTSSDLLVAHETGRIDEDEFERGFAERLRAHGADVSADGLLWQLQSAMHRDDAMVRLVAAIRAAGHRVGLLSNALGSDCYAGFDLDSMFDAVTISSEIGTRKPSRQAYRQACERLGAAPDETIMVDDLEQNITAAARIGLAGIVHHDAATTAEQLWTQLSPQDSTDTPS